MENIDITLQCDMLTNLNSKTESDCIEEEAAAYQLFQSDHVTQRLKLNPDEYFGQFKTVAFRKVSYCCFFLVNNFSSFSFPLCQLLLLVPLILYQP